MKLLIVGSRTILAFDLSRHIPAKTELIISGGAKGIDQLAERYADQHKISKLILYPQYSRYGKAAPIKRNEAMVALADAVLVIWDGTSKGSKYIIEYTKKKNKPITVIVPNNRPPKNP